MEIYNEVSQYMFLNYFFSLNLTPQASSFSSFSSVTAFSTCLKLLYIQVIYMYKHLGR